MSPTGIYNTRKVRSARHVCDEFDVKSKNNNRVQVKRRKLVPRPNSTRGFEFRPLGNVANVFCKLNTRQYILCKLDMELKLQLVVSGTPYHKPKDRLQSYYVTIHADRAKQGFKNPLVDPRMFTYYPAYDLGISRKLFSKKFP